jgi:hypothetical protein
LFDHADTYLLQLCHDLHGFLRREDLVGVHPEVCLG